MNNIKSTIVATTAMSLETDGFDELAWVIVGAIFNYLTVEEVERCGQLNTAWLAKIEHPTIKAARSHLSITRVHSSSRPQHDTRLQQFYWYR